MIKVVLFCTIAAVKQTHDITCKDKALSSSVEDESFLFGSVALETALFSGGLDDGVSEGGGPGCGSLGCGCCGGGGGGCV